MPTFIITPRKHEKPLPSLPRTEGQVRRTSLQFQEDDCSIYSYSSSTYSDQRFSYERRVGARRDSETSLEPSQHSLVPSILKSRSADNHVDRRRKQRKSVRFLPIIDNLLRHALHSRCIAHDLRFPPHSARIPSPIGHKVLGGFSSGQYLPFCRKTRAQPALSPPVARMWIVSYEFPWVVEVNGTAPGAPEVESHRFMTSSKGKGNHTETAVTIYDVLHTLWSNLQKPVVEPEWLSLSSSRRRSIRRTCLAAYAHEPSRSLQIDSVSGSRSHKPEKTFETRSSSDTRRIARRIDWLGTSTRFAGLGKDDALIAERIEEPWKRELTWVLVLDDNEYRYEDLSSKD